MLNPAGKRSIAIPRKNEPCDPSGKRGVSKAERTLIGSVFRWWCWLALGGHSVGPK